MDQAGGATATPEKRREKGNRNAVTAVPQTWVDGRPPCGTNSQGSVDIC